MRRLLSGITILTVFAGCVASVGAEARDWRGHGYRSGNFHAAIYQSGGSRGRYAGAWRGGGYRGNGFTELRPIRDTTRAMAGADIVMAGGGGR